MNYYLIALIWPVASVVVSIFICLRSGQLSRREEQYLARYKEAIQ